MRKQTSTAGNNREEGRPAAWRRKIQHRVQTIRTIKKNRDQTDDVAAQFDCGRPSREPHGMARHKKNVKLDTENENERRRRRKRRREGEAKAHMVEGAHEQRRLAERVMRSIWEVKPW